MVVTGGITPRWMCWFAPMDFVRYIVYEFPIGFATTTAFEAGSVIKSKCEIGQVMTIISWCAYPKHCHGVTVQRCGRLLLSGTV